MFIKDTIILFMQEDRKIRGGVCISGNVMWEAWCMKIDQNIMWDKKLKTQYQGQ